MHTESIVVTPAQASEWLKSNTDNRPLRRNVVESIKNALLRGEYVQTHQGIAFGEDGTLLDGQHRLTAISELRDGGFPMLVTFGMQDAAFKAIDLGLKRSASDVLKLEQRLVECARLVAVLCTTSAARFAPSPIMLEPYIARIAQAHDDLLCTHPGKTRTWASAPVRTAAIVSILNGGDRDYILRTYRQLCRRDLDEMPPVARALFRSEAIGSVSAKNPADMIARSLVVFDKRRAQNKLIKVLDKDSVLLLMRETFKDIVEMQQAKIVAGKPKKPSK